MGPKKEGRLYFFNHSGGNSFFDITNNLPSGIYISDIAFDPNNDDAEVAVGDKVLSLTTDGRAESNFTSQCWINMNGTGTIAIRDSFNVSGDSSNQTPQITSKNDIITNEIFADFSKPNSIVSCIRIDDYMSSWNAYDNNISDHRPVGLKLEMDAVISDTHELEIPDIKLIKVVDLLGKEVRKNTKGILFYMYDNGSVAKRIVVE